MKKKSFKVGKERKRAKTNNYVSREEKFEIFFVIEKISFTVFVFCNKVDALVSPFITKLCQVECSTNIIRIERKENNTSWILRVTTLLCFLF